ncbi:MAG: hypothetical protein LWY06_20490 [Firmicutes bacterium]|nr:hypothetical protein [Bacillota bacterium]
MKKLLSAVVAAAFLLLLAAGAATASEVKFKDYVNKKFGYTVSHPDLFTKSTTLENNAGVRLENAKGTIKMEIWAEVATGKETGKELLKEAQSRVAHISKEEAGDKCYAVDYEGGEKDGNRILFFERGYISGKNIIRFFISCPASEKARFALYVQKMYDARSNKAGEPAQKKGSFTPLVNAVCFSQILHFNSFKTEPDGATVNLTLHNLVTNGEFRWKNKLKVTDGAYYFSRGPESEDADPGKKGVYISPEMLYSDFFKSGKYVYAPSTMSKFVDGTQTGIAVYVKKIPYSADVKINSTEEKNGYEVVKATITRVDTKSGKKETLGDAVITLKQDAKAFFGYKIVSFEPAYGKFADIKL